MAEEKFEVFDPDKLQSFSTRAFEKVGVPHEDAEITSRFLVQADLRGVATHGVAHLAPFYIKRIKDGLINVNPKFKFMSRAPGTAVLEADHALGFVAGHRAMAEAIRRARNAGAGFVAVRNSTHYGAGTGYALMALPHDMIGISLNTGGRGAAAPGASGRTITINVISIAVPSGKEFPFVLDMATTTVAHGKTEIAERLGKTMPEGWVIDPEGKPITDPKETGPRKGAMTPLGIDPLHGAYKGFGLAVAVDILCSILSGYIPSPQLYDEPKSTGRGNHFFGAINVDGFIPAQEFKERMDALIRYYHALPRMPGVERITLAGEPEYELERERRKKGIPLDPVVVKSLKDLAKELNIEYDL